MNDKIPPLLLLCAAVLFLLYIIMYAPNNRNKKEPNAKPNEKEKTAPKKHSTPQARSTTSKTFKGIKLDISMIPPSVNLDDSLLPYSVNRQYGFGKRFNSFVIDNDLEHFHKSTCVEAKSHRKTLIHKYVAVQRYKPCSKCNPNATIDDWYIKFLKVNFGGTQTDIQKFEQEFYLKSSKLPVLEQLSLEDKQITIVK